MTAVDSIVASLVEQRQALGLSQRALTDKLGHGLNPSIISRWERGGVSPTLHSLRSWCEALGADLVIVRHLPADELEVVPRGVCEVCGEHTDTPPVCGPCDIADETRAKRRADR